MAAFQTDSLNPTHLSSGVLGRRRHASSTRAGLFDSGAPALSARDRFAAEWNTRIDKEVRAVVDGLGELVDLADIGAHPAPHQAPPQALHLRLRTAQLVRAAQALRDTAHELRLMLVLSNELDTAQRRDAEMRAVRAEVKRGREAVGRGVRGLFLGEGEAEGEAGAEGEGEGEGDVGVGGEGEGGGGRADVDVDVDVDEGAEQDNIRGAAVEEGGEARGAVQSAQDAQSGGEARPGEGPESASAQAVAAPISAQPIPALPHEDEDDSDDFEEV